MEVSTKKEVERIFHKALELPSKERILFLEEECAGDGELYSEVKSLLKSFEQDSAILEEPVFEIGLSAIDKTSRKNIANSTIGFYELSEKIGAGGMGEVYEAIDTHLDRRVALKFLSTALENDRSAKRQLVKEARAVAMLEHPNICAVHGIEETDDHHFIVMQYIEGKTLDESFEGRSIELDEFNSIARQILEAVAFAHSHGVIHRDLKPGNIMLTDEGHIKVLDFGLAKVIRQNQFLGSETSGEVSNFSSNGLVIGTVSYMSPEQLRGEKLDYRSDIFSIGVMLFEQLTRQNPFKRESQAEIIAAILSDEPSVLSELAPGFPERLIFLVEKCLQKEPDDRFQSVAEILIALDEAQNENSYESATRRYYGFVVKAVFATIIVLAVFVFGYFQYNSNPQQRTLAVLPISFENPPPDKEYLADGLTRSIIDKLSNLSDIKITNRFAVASLAGKSNPPQLVGKQLKVDAVFAGSIAKRNNVFVLETKLVRTSDGFVIDAADFPIDENNLIDLQENAVIRIIGKIRLNLTDEDKTKIAKKDTESEEAKRNYFLGRYYLNRRAGDDMNNAVMKFKAAVELDPYYSKAWSGLADAYITQSLPGVENSISPKEAIGKARAATKRALEIDENSSESYNSLGLINSRFDWNWNEAETNFRKAINRNPDFIPARKGLLGVLNVQGRFDEALKEANKIKELDPISTTGDLEIAKVHYRKRNFREMETIISEVLRRNPSNDRISYIQSYLFLNTGRYFEAISLLEKIYSSGKQADQVFAAAPLGFAYAKTGRRDEAVEIIEKLEELAKTVYVPPQEMSFVYIGLGDNDKAFEHLFHSCEERFQTLPLWITDPVVDDIKTDERFSEIKQCVGL